MPNTLEKDYKMKEDMDPEISQFDCCDIMNRSTDVAKNHELCIP